MLSEGRRDDEDNSGGGGEEGGRCGSGRQEMRAGRRYDGKERR